MHDSGGPLFATVGGDVVQVGLVSWRDGDNCALAGVPGVYTRAAFRDWLGTHSDGAIGFAGCAATLSRDAHA